MSGNQGARRRRTSGARANYANLLSCLNKTWPALVTKSGARFRPFSGNVTTPCGTGNDSGPPFYCGSNETIYMNLSEDIGNYNRYPRRTRRCGRGCGCRTSSPTSTGTTSRI